MPRQFRATLCIALYKPLGMLGENFINPYIIGSYNAINLNVYQE